jgi:predicted aspartyl protease
MSQKINLQSIRVTAIVALCSATVLLAPAATQSQTRENHLAEVPFELVHDQIVMSAKIGGKGPFNLLLDTDTDPSAVDLATARDVGLNISSKAQPASGGGTDANSVYLTKLPQIELGPVSAKNVTAGAIDLAKLSKRLGRTIHGVLGYSFLKDRIVQIDYPAQLLRFYESTPYPGIQYAANTVNRIAIPFRYDDEVLIEGVFINGHKLRATLDTGSSGRISLTPEAVKLLGLDDEKEKTRVEKSVGYNGEYEHKVGILKSVRIGRLSLESTEASFWLPNTGHDKKNFQVNLGNGFMKDYVVTFDFPAKLVVLEEAP